MNEILTNKPKRIKTNSLVIKCPAKINLFLNITGIAKNEYHQVSLINQTVNLEDEIILSRGTGKFTVDDPSVPNNEHNSVIKALQLFAKYTDQNPGLFDVELKKRIPTMAGLGGASTDAAVILIGLNILSGAYLSNTELKRLAIQVGSDVPFFIDGGYKKVTGIGETVENWEPANPFNNYIIVKPDISYDTRNMYKRLDKISGRKYNERLYWGFMHNDFETVADSQILDIKNLLLEEGAITAGMTGSGSAVVGVYTSTPKIPFQMIKSIYPNSFQVTNSRGISIGQAR